MKATYDEFIFLPKMERKEFGEKLFSSNGPSSEMVAGRLRRLKLLLTEQEQEVSEKQRDRVNHILLGGNDCSARMAELQLTNVRRFVREKHSVHKTALREWTALIERKATRADFRRLLKEVDGRRLDLLSSGRKTMDKDLCRFLILGKNNPDDQYGFKDLVIRQDFYLAEDLLYEGSLRVAIHPQQGNTRFLRPALFEASGQALEWGTRLIENLKALKATSGLDLSDQMICAEVLKDPTWVSDDTLIAEYIKNVVMDQLQSGRSKVLCVSSDVKQMKYIAGRTGIYLYWLNPKDMSVRQVQALQNKGLVPIEKLVELGLVSKESSGTIYPFVLVDSGSDEAQIKRIMNDKFVKKITVVEDTLLRTVQVKYETGDRVPRLNVLNKRTFKSMCIRKHRFTPGKSPG